MDENIIDSLIEAAKEAAKYAYVPYSSFPVGAAVLTDDGKIFSGTNIENASFGGTVCAERVAIFKAVSEGHTAITALAVYNENTLPYPCGICRQVMTEFSDDMPIIVASDYSVKKHRLSELMPCAFKGDIL
ncbi:MAG: cytidine deaminase [Clostridia bacterium]|nr:cytidine deaminase [Clostridia bacterium]